MPADWAPLTVTRQDGDPDSMLMLYRRALSLRAIHPGVGRGTVRWRDAPEGVLALDVGHEDFPVTVIVNTRDHAVPLPEELAGATVMIASDPSLLAGTLLAEVPKEAAVWLCQP
jgi:alpha-glucosidase